jgi:hypothetical protein
MSILRGLIGGEQKAMDASALSWPALYGGPASKSGVNVNVETALGSPPFSVAAAF